MQHNDQSEQEEKHKTSKKHDVSKQPQTRSHASESRTALSDDKDQGKNEPKPHLDGFENEVDEWLEGIVREETDLADVENEAGCADDDEDDEGTTSC